MRYTVHYRYSDQVIVVKLLTTKFRELILTMGICILMCLTVINGLDQKKEDSIVIDHRVSDFDIGLLSLICQSVHV